MTKSLTGDRCRNHAPAADYTRLGKTDKARFFMEIGH
jgi:hypothetical protein